MFFEGKIARRKVLHDVLKLLIAERDLSPFNTAYRTWIGNTDLCLVSCGMS